MIVRGRKSFSVNRGSQPCQCTVPPPTICGTGQNSSTLGSSVCEVRTVRGLSSGSGHKLKRLTLASSSPPKVSRVRHGPRSRATTRHPRSVSTLAAVAPEAPAPMMQTSARSGFALGATVVLLSRVPKGIGEVLDHAVPAGVHLGERGRSREADEVPTDPVTVPAVDRIGVEALAGVQGQQRQEVQLGFHAGLLQGGLHRGESRPDLRLVHFLLDLPYRLLQLGQDLVLLLAGEVGEVRAEPGVAASVEFLDAGGVLVAQDVQALLPGLGPPAVELLEAAAVGLGVDVIEAGQVPVEEVDGACLAGAGLVVGRDDAGHRCRHRLPLMRVEETVCPHAGTSSQVWSCAESRTAWVSTAARSPSANVGSPSGLCPATAEYTSDTNAVNES